VNVGGAALAAGANSINSTAKNPWMRRRQHHPLAET
jgi:hypothetical protein